MNELVNMLPDPPWMNPPWCWVFLATVIVIFIVACWWYLQDDTA